MSMPDTHFKVGEIAIAHNWQLQFACYNGSEVQVVGRLTYRTATDPIGTRACTLTYRVRAPDGREMAVRPDALRKRKDPGVTTWSELRDVWQPAREECRG